MHASKSWAQYSMNSIRRSVWPMNASSCERINSGGLYFSQRDWQKK